MYLNFLSFFIFRLEHLKANTSGKLEYSSHSVNRTLSTVPASTATTAATVVSWTTPSNTSRTTRVSTLRRPTPMRLSMTRAVTTPKTAVRRMLVSSTFPKVMKKSSWLPLPRSDLSPLPLMPPTRPSNSTLKVRYFMFFICHLSKIICVITFSNYFLLFFFCYFLTNFYH